MQNPSAKKGSMGAVFIPPATCSLLSNQKTEAYRVASGNGIWMERFGPAFVISTHQKPDTKVVAQLQKWCKKNAQPCEAIYYHSLSEKPGNHSSMTLVEGSPLKQPLIVRELQVQYTIHLNCYPPGLALDQRENRIFLSSRKPKSLLNLFAHTCPFSLVAAMRGAETTNIDVSEKILEWGKKNFTTNNLLLRPHKFIQEDAGIYLQKCVRKNAQYDCIILDAPTTSRSKIGGVFQVEERLPLLMEQALQILRPGGSILVTTNSKSFTFTGLAAKALDILRKLGRKAEFHRTPDLPDVAPEDAPASLWILTD